MVHMRKEEFQLLEDSRGEHLFLCPRVSPCQFNWSTQTCASNILNLLSQSPHILPTAIDTLFCPCPILPTLISLLLPILLTGGAMGIQRPVACRTHHSLLQPQPICMAGMSLFVTAGKCLVPQRHSFQQV